MGRRVEEPGTGLRRSILTLDRGNSTLDAALWDSARAAQPLQRRRFAPEAAAELVAWLDGPRGRSPALPIDALAASVVPGGLDAGEDALSALGVAVRRVPRDLPLPIAVDYATPETLGVDRVLAACGAVALAGAPVVVVDCGTATTVNVVGADGVFCGGAIGPGFDGLVESMARRTPHLPAFDVRALEPPPARSSAGSVAVGLVLGWVGLVERLVASAAPPGAPVVVTGGRAALYLEHGTGGRLADDLVHRGLLRAWELRCAC